MSTSNFMKRLERLEQAILLKQPRQITIMVDGDKEDHSAAEDALLQELAPSKDDLVIYLRHFGGDDPDLLRLLSVIKLRA